MIDLLDTKYWYKNSIIYQIHVKSFFDSNENGIGDFKGLSLKLDYIESLGINTIWLLPFYPSPLKDDGYDISDYFNVHKDYGTLRDFKIFLKEAHKRNIKVITELVINHTSDQHEWFKRARKSNINSSERNYYMWSDTNEKFKDCRIIFKDFEESNWTWDPVAKEYYWHRFFYHQPDLNFDNPKVHKEIFKIVDFWFGLGVDGMRLDAIPYLYARDGTSCENLPETHLFLKKLRKHIDKKFSNKMILAEANQWPEEIVKYFGDGDECHMAFNFPIMPRIFMSLKMEDRFPLIDILNQTPNIPDNCQWVVFLRNHDELTLEMVTDEERDYMYRVYAIDPKSRINLGIRRRLAPLLNNDIKKIELINALLFSLPGTPVIYYGDEIGMGDNYYLGDRNGVRTPMQWNSDKNAGFSKADQRELFLPIITDPKYHYEAVNVENNEKNPDSILWFMRKIISIRNELKSLCTGSFKIIYCNNNKIFSFIRILNEEKVLVIINLSKNIQSIDLYLSEFSDFIPTEVFSNTKLPIITKKPYSLVISGLSFYWLKLDKKSIKPSYNVDILYSPNEYSDSDKFIKKLLASYLKKISYFEKNLTLKEIEIIESFNISNSDATYYIFKAHYNEDLPEYYCAFIARKKIYDLNYLDNLPNETILIKINENNEKEIFYDAFRDSNLRKSLFSSFTNSKNIKFNQVSNSIKRNFIYNSNSWLIESSSRNYLINYDNKLLIKIYKSFEFQPRPEIELIKFLKEKEFHNLPDIKQIITYNGAEIGIIQNYIPNEGNFWDYSLKEIRLFFEKIISSKDKLFNKDSIFDKKEFIKEQIGPFYLNLIEKLADVTSEMHILLASDFNNKTFAPEVFTQMYQRSIYQFTRSKIKKSLENLNLIEKKLPEFEKNLLANILSKEDLMLKMLKKILIKKFEGLRIRNHGEFSLKQILFTGNNFLFIDFDGISIRSFSERKIKRSILREVAFLLRSFKYVINTAFIQDLKLKSVKHEELFEITEIWYEIIEDVFLKHYFKKVEKYNLIPSKNEDKIFILNIFLLNELFSSVNYEIKENLKNILIPLISIKNILNKLGV